MVEGLIYLIVYIAVVACIGALIMWALREIPVPEPFNRILRVLVIVVTILIVVLLLLNFMGALPYRRMP